VFNQGESALHTKRILKLNLNTLFLGLVGGIAGIYELITTVMGKVEGHYEDYKEKKELKRSKPSLVSDHRLANYWETDADNSTQENERFPNRQAK
jgi:hypothetical protein